MTTGHDVFQFLNQFAPVSTQMDFDNSGFLVGDCAKPVKRVLVTLDITEDVVREAQELNADFIVSHHPLIFHKLSAVCENDPTQRKIMMLIRSGISAVCMHTNLDVAYGGVNDALMEVIGARAETILEPTGTDADGRMFGCGRIGYLPQKMPVDAFLPYLTERLHVSGIRYVSSGKPVFKIAVCGGSGGEFLEAAHQAGCDTFITADVKYDRFLTAKELGMNLFDADHFCTENVVIPKLSAMLKSHFPELDVTVSRLKQTTQFYAAR